MSPPQSKHRHVHHPRATFTLSSFRVPACLRQHRSQHAALAANCRTSPPSTRQIVIVMMGAYVTTVWYAAVVSSGPNWSPQPESQLKWVATAVSAAMTWDWPL